MIERNVIARRVKRAGYRDIVEAPGFDPETNPRIAAEAADDISMEDVLWAEIVPWTAEIHGMQKVTVRVMELWAGMTREEYRRHLDPYVNITEQREASYTPDGVAPREELTFSGGLERLTTTASYGVLTQANWHARMAQSP